MGKDRKTWTLQQSLSDQKGEVMPHLENDLTTQLCPWPTQMDTSEILRREILCVYVAKCCFNKSSNTLGKKQIILNSSNHSG